MPTYELSLVMRHALARPQLVDAIKRSAVEIMGRGGYIRQLQYLGDRVLPQKGSRGKGKGQTRGHYFMLQVDLPSKELLPIGEEINRDNDVIRKTFIGLDTTASLREQPPLECTLHEELKSPSERPSVQKMMALGRKAPRFTHVWNPKTGMDFYPFHR